MLAVLKLVLNDNLLNIVMITVEDDMMIVFSMKYSSVKAIYLTTVSHDECESSVCDKYLASNHVCH